MEEHAGGVALQQTASAADWPRCPHERIEHTHVDTPRSPRNPAEQGSGCPKCQVARLQSPTNLVPCCKSPNMSAHSLQTC